VSIDNTLADQQRSSPSKRGPLDSQTNQFTPGQGYRAQASRQGMRHRARPPVSAQPRRALHSAYREQPPAFQTSTCRIMGDRPGGASYSFVANGVRRKRSAQIESRSTLDKCGGRPFRQIFRNGTKCQYIYPRIACEAMATVRGFSRQTSIRVRTGNALWAVRVPGQSGENLQNRPTPGFKRGARDDRIGGGFLWSLSTLECRPRQRKTHLDDSRRPQHSAVFTANSKVFQTATIMLEVYRPCSYLKR